MFCKAKLPSYSLNFVFSLTDTCIILNYFLLLCLNCLATLISCLLNKYPGYFHWRPKTCGETLSPSDSGWLLMLVATHLAFYTMVLVLKIWDSVIFLCLLFLFCQTICHKYIFISNCFIIIWIYTYILYYVFARNNIVWL